MKEPKRWLDFFETLFLVLLSAVPLIWFRHGNLLASVDTLLPQTWEDNLRLLHAWNHRIGTGALHLFDQAAFLFNLLPAGVMKVGGSIWHAQVVEFCFWFGLAGFSAYWMMRLLYQGPYPRVARLVAASFYACNFYLVPIWVGFNKPNIALYAVLPLLLAWYLTILSGERRIWPTAGWIALVSLAASTAGTNTPVAMVGAMAWLLATVVFVFLSLWKRQWKTLARQLWAAALIVLLLIAVHAFWIFPQLAAGLGNSQQTPLQEARHQALDYVEGLSRFTSFWNVIRFQGDWGWYTGGEEPIVLYARQYLEQPPWIVLGWLLVGTFLVGTLVPSVPFRAVFLLIAGVGILFSMGTHPPTGWLFRWMVLHVPGFWMFRSMWYKFMLLTSLGYAFFLGVGVASWIAKQRSRSPVGPAIAAVLLVVLYAHPVVAGTMFPTVQQRKAMPPLQFQVPAYVEAAAEWFPTQPRDGRIFALPGRGVWANQWGYPGLTPFLWYQTQQSWVYEMDPGWQMVSQGAPQESLEITKLIRQSFNPYHGNLTPRLDRLFKILGVQYVLHESDYRYDLLPLPDTPQAMRQRLSEQKGLKKLKAFGPWEVYEVNDPQLHWMSLSGLAAAWGDPSWMLEFSQTDLLDQQVIWWANDGSSEQIQQLSEGGLIHRVILCGDAPLPRILEKSEVLQKIPVTLLVSSRRLATLEQLTQQNPLFLAPEGLTSRWNQAHDPALIEKDKSDWSWVVPGQEPDVAIENPYSFPVVAVLAFEIRTYDGGNRIFYPMLNGKPVHVDMMGVQTTLPVGSGPQKVILPAVELRPGHNSFKFYTTEGWVRVGQDLFSFGVRGFQVGNPIVQATLHVPENGSYRVRLYPQYQGAITDREVKILKTRQIQIGELPVELIPHQDVLGLWYWEDAQVPLSEGRTTLKGETFLGENWVAEIAQLPEPSLPVVRQKIEPVDHSATFYQLDFRLTEPQVLVFNESYHPGWEASSWTHLKVNGFANAWVVPAGHHSISISFEPQKWSRVGQEVSMFCCGILVVGVGYALLRAGMKGN